MRRFQRKEYPYAPLHLLSGMDLVEVDEGTCTWRLPATPWLRSAAGIPIGGVLAFAADAALGGPSTPPFRRGRSWPPRSCLSTSFGLPT